MTEDEQPNRIEATPAPTRRAALRAGGAAVAALLAAGPGERAEAAQEATPGASLAGAAADLEGLYAVLRLRKLKAGVSADEVLALGKQEVLPLLREIPQFVVYFGAANPETGDAFFVDFFTDQAGAEESSRRVAEWLTSNSYDFFEGELVEVEGAVAVAGGADRPPA